MTQGEYRRDTDWGYALGLRDVAKRQGTSLQNLQSLVRSQPSRPAVCKVVNKSESLSEPACRTAVADLV